MTLIESGQAHAQVGKLTHASTDQAFLFASFRLIPAQQLLLDGDTPVPIGSRAMEILVALLERPGELVGKNELIRRVWPNTVVEEANLKVHVAALRRAIGDGRPGRRYVATVPGRGYRFVARVEISASPKPVGARANNLPSSPTRTIDRVDAVDALEQLLQHHRLVTIVGPAGIGKTTVALAVGQARLAAYGDGVWLIDLAPVSDPRFVPGAMASAIGVTLHSEDSVAALVACIRERKMLVVLDSCEHLIEAVAVLAEEVITAAPSIHVISTSRERLRARGERVYRLSPLPSPPNSVALTVEEALKYPAVELFVERAEASLDSFELTEGNASDVADICRKLEGIALAIELTATRIDAFAPRELSALLDDRFQLLSQSSGNVGHRHRSLEAALDWSHNSLSERERIILRRLSVFAGSFTLGSAAAVAGDARLSAAEVIDGVANLVAKSLVSANLIGTATQYRLLETTRAYARQKLAASDELDTTHRAHAMHHLDLFDREGLHPELPLAVWLAEYGRKIDDVRDALNWAFSSRGDDSIGVALTVAAIPLWTHLSLLTECRARVELALARDTSVAPGRECHEMKLLAALGAALLYTKGPLPETEVAWTRALQIAQRVGDKDYQLRALWGLSIYQVYVGNNRAALYLVESYRDVATQQGDLEDQLGADRLAATVVFYLGDFVSARNLLDRVLTQYVNPTHRPLHVARFQFDQRVAARSTFSNLLWMQGFPEQAVRSAIIAIEDAQKTDHPLSLCNALGHAAFPIALYVGDLSEAERLLAMLLDHLAKHALSVWNVLGSCLRGMLLTRQSDGSGLELLEGALKELREAGFHLRHTSYLGMLAQGLAAAGRVGEARAVIEEALQWTERTEARWFLAELLRIKGDLYQMEATAAALATAEDCFRQALDWARQQQALSWELRAALGLAQLAHQSGRTREGYALLSSVYDRFTEGFETLDLRTARSTMASLRAALH